MLKLSMKYGWKFKNGVDMKEGIQLNAQLME